jgi:hypothetical protein
MGDPGPRLNTAGRLIAPRPRFLYFLRLPTFVYSAFSTGIRAPDFLDLALLARMVWQIGHATQLVFFAFFAS